LERQRFDYVITLCDRVREVCPQFPGRAEQLHWSIPDPAAPSGAGRDTYPAFERMAAELETRIGFLLAAIGAAPVQASIQEV
jgi:protein-tyrosine-phosphatase